MKSQTLTQYHSEMKMIVDHIVATGSIIYIKDISLYTLNGLPSIYSSFKSFINISLVLSSLEDLYNQLISKEINVHTMVANEHALYVILYQILCEFLSRKTNFAHFINLIVTKYE